MKLSFFLGTLLAVMELSSANAQVQFAKQAREFPKPCEIICKPLNSIPMPNSNVNVKWQENLANKEYLLFAVGASVPETIQFYKTIAVASKHTMGSPAKEVLISSPSVEGDLSRLGSEFNRLVMSPSELSSALGVKPEQFKSCVISIYSTNPKSGFVYKQDLEAFSDQVVQYGYRNTTLKGSAIALTRYDVVESESDFLTLPVVSTFRIISSNSKAKVTGRLNELKANGVCKP